MLTREDAKEVLWGNGHIDSAWIIDKIYDEHEAQMETLDDKYAEAVNLYESAVMEFHEKT